MSTIRLTTIMLVSSLVGSTALAGKSDAWINVHSPIKVGTSSQQRLQTKIWLHRPSQATFVDVSEEYLPGLPSPARLKVYCKSLKTHFPKVDYYKFSSKSCVVSGVINGQRAIEGATVKNIHEVRHFASTGSSLEQLNQVADDFTHLLDRMAVNP